MKKRRSRATPAFSIVNATLESRIVLSGASLTGTVEVASVSMHKVATQTSLAISAGTLGQPITFTVTVKAPASAGSPGGTVDILDHGKVIDTVTLSPIASSNARFAYSQGTVTLTQPPGGGAYYFGKHTLSAEFLASGSFAKSTASKTFVVAQPTYLTLADGVKTSTILAGTGPQIQSGQTASVLYTGYLAKNGKIFDDSINDGGAPFSFTLGAGDVIPGFDAGTTGMQVGETRIVEIPAAEGYGSTVNGPIPANSTLLFVITLESIS